MTQTLTALSQSIGQIVASAARLVSAIRVGPNRHITGLVCQGDMIITTDQALPTADSYTVVLPNRQLAGARPGPRDPGCNLAVLRLDAPWPSVNPEVAVTSVGNLVLVLGADADASPTVRLTVVHKMIRTADGSAPVLDLSGDNVDPGSPVLDASGRLIGLAALSPSGETLAIPSAVIGRMLMPNRSLGAPLSAPAVAPTPPSNRRGWFGVALQPITVPDHLVARASQASGRLVVRITKGGPAEIAGMRIGDVLLALNGTSASGPQAMRAVLAAEPVGSTVEVKLLRDGKIMTTHLTVAVQPG